MTNKTPSVNKHKVTRPTGENEVGDANNKKMSVPGYYGSIKQWFECTVALAHVVKMNVGLNRPAKISEIYTEQAPRS